MDAELDLLIKEMCGRWEADVESWSAITPDASLRRYYRLRLGEKRPIADSSAVMMVFDSVASPESGGAGESVDSDLAYLELSGFLKNHSIAVPELYVDGRDRGAFIIEDLGDFQLADAVIGDSSATYSSAQIEALYREAIDGALALQRIPRDDSRFFFRRRFDRAAFVLEMMEFWDFVLEPLGDQAVRPEIITGAFAQLAVELEQIPFSLVHRDYHSWNLMLDYEGAVRVIDFQDALCGPRCYDIVGLLNDRDTDAALGDERYVRLLKYYAEAVGEESIYREYNRTLLQRDLKVAGRFSKLAETRGLLSYRLWVPGTLRRIGRTLQRMVAEPEGERRYGPMLDELVRLLPDVAAGADQPLTMD